MIVRKRAINTSNAEVQISISYSSADLKKWMQRFVRILVKTPDAVPYWKEQTMAEGEFRYWFEHDPHCFLNVEDPWRTQLSQWAFKQLLKLGYITPSGNDENKYFLSEKSLKFADGKSVEWP